MTINRSTPSYPVRPPVRRPSTFKLIVGGLIAVTVSLAVKTLFATMAVWLIAEGLIISIPFWNMVAIGLGASILLGMTNGGDSK